MSTSIYLSRFFALLLFIIFPLYLATRGTDSLSDIALVFSSLSGRAELLHVALTSPLNIPPAPISKETVEASAEPVKSGRRRRYPSSLPDGLAHCINSYERYPALAEQVLQRKYARYSKQTPAQKVISDKLGYHRHFEKAREGIEVNTQFSEQIARIAREDYRAGSRVLEDDEDAELGLVTEAFGHVRRDWSAQGVQERQAVFPPILDGLEKHFGGKDRAGNRVLVPGSGLGRLASDIADLGMSSLLN